VLKKHSEHVILIPPARRGICFLFVFNEKQPAAAGFAEFTLKRSEGLSMTETLFQLPAKRKGGTNDGK
jgi:hypothetical protein